ncbi:hypothetical protein [Cellulomonas sp. URHB0016]
MGPGAASRGAQEPSSRADGVRASVRTPPVVAHGAPPRPSLPGPAATRLVGLQRSAGNRAVVGLLARAAPVTQPAVVTAPVTTGPVAVPALTGALGEAFSPAPAAAAAPVAAVQRSYVNDRTWTPVEPNTGQGTGVDAIVGPHFTYGQKTGAAPGFRPYDYMRLFKTVTGVSYVQGHLLNDNLGGPARSGTAHADENLTAFPKVPTNVDHSNGIEEWVKAAAAGSWFRYRVTIGYSTDSGPRLRKRLGAANLGVATAAGIAPAAATFTYASSLFADWDELVDATAHTNAAPVLKPAGISGTLSLAIPSPMSATKPATRALEFPAIPNRSWQHHENFKQTHRGVWTGVLPPGGAANAPPNPARTFILAERWRGNDDARAGNPTDPGGNAVYLLGHQHYGEGVTGSRAGPKSTTRFGRGYLLGYKDFDDGIVHGKKNPLATPPTNWAAEIAGHTELWAGVAKGRTALLAAPPVTNRAEIAGHAEYWEGVKHARTHAKASPPAAKAAQKAGHDDYWAGIEHAQKSAKGTPPVNNLAQKEAHDAYWDAAEKVVANLAVAAPTVQAGLAAHTDALGTMTFARANPRTGVVATPTLVQTAVWTTYWQGVDLARKSAPPVVYTGKDAPAAAAFTEYREGTAQAAKSLATLTAAPPAGGGAAEGFTDYKQGVEAAIGGQPADVARPAHTRGWTDASEGFTEGDAAKAPSRAEGGFTSGHLYGKGAALARAGGAAPTGASTEEAVGATGHGDYRKGLAAARTDRKSAKPADRGAALGFGEFLTGITKAQAGVPAGPAPTGSEATTAGWTEYWRGADLARTGPSGPYAGSSSAESAGHEDYRSGVEGARASLAALAGAPPVGGGAALGFADYRDGVEDRKAGAATDPKRTGQARGWQDSGDGMAEADTGTKPSRTDGGYASGYLYAHGAVAARAGHVAPTGGGVVEDALTGVGHADYRSGVDAARADRNASKPTRTAAARGFDEFVSGLSQAQAGVRTGPAPASSDASAAGWAEYWRGVDAGRTSAWGTPYAGTSSAAAAGHADYRSGAVLARTDLPSMTGAAPAGGGRGEGFEDYRQGVEHGVGGRPADATRSAHATGWADAIAGVAAGQAGSASARTEGGFTSGHLYGQGAAAARGGGSAPATTATVEDQLTAAGHGHYGDGITAARADRDATPPPEPGARLGFDEFVAGIARARAGLRSAPPGADNVATTAGWTEYWQGVDRGQAAVWGAPYGGASSAGSAGYADYRAGADAASATLARLTGAAPAGGGAAVGFADYRAGVEDRKSGAVADVARSARARGWQDCADGMARGQEQVDAATDRTDGGFVSGYLHAQGGARAHSGLPDAPATTPEEAVRSTGHAGYTAGLDAARRDLATPPGRLVDRAAFDAYGNALAAARTAPRRQAVGGAAGDAAVTDYWNGVDAARAQPHAAAVATASTAAAQGVTDYQAGVVHAVGNAAGTPPPATTAGAEGAGDYWSGEAHAVGSVNAPGGHAAADTAFHHFRAGRAHARAGLAQLQGAAPAGRVTARGFREYAAGVAAGHAAQPDQPARVVFSKGWGDYAAGETDKRNGVPAPVHQHGGYLYGYNTANAPVAKRPGDPLLGGTEKKQRR